MTQITAIIVAAGSGARMNDNTPSNENSRPKQYREINGKALINYSLEVFLNHQQIDNVICVVSEPHLPLYHETIMPHDKLQAPIIGGNSRQQSVKNALVHIKKNMPETSYVLIHDAARPLITAAQINNVIKPLTSKAAKGVTLSSKAVDSFRRGEQIDTSVHAKDFINRDNLYALHTPQGFCFKTILDAHLNTKNLSHTDDTSLLTEIGEDILLAEGSRFNLKVTTSEDLLFVEKLLQNKE
jgi:2-C-methyl-D-erythritol 4-phosphate cytidylyltransferase/2-C-methyl-D-erythritol 2,4-cyclodiphosphate synthase